MSNMAADLLAIENQLTQELLRRNADDAEKSLFVFLRDFAWPVLFPATPFLDNWHIHVLCEHLEAVTRGEIKQFLCNMPFRHLKSTIISQAWPAWEWITLPSTEYLTASYARDLATRDAVNSRRIIESDNYQMCWGDKFAMTSDQNVKTRYENDKRGQRTVTSTDSGGTGFGGNRIIVDDPISAKAADSITAILASVEWWKGTLSTRMNNPKEDAKIVVHQRLNEADLTGYILENEDMSEWVHLILPLRYEKEFTKTTSLGFVDPRSKEGELLQEARIDEAAAKKLETNLGEYHTQGQLQQRPGTRGGIIFKRDNFKHYDVAPDVRDIVISADCTFKDLATSDYVAIQVWGLQGENKVMLYRLRERMGFAATCTALENVISKFPSRIAILIEDKANGSAVIETLKQKFAGVTPINPDGGKDSRAMAMQPEQEAGNIFLPSASVDPDIETFIFAATKFPNASVPDDEVDAMTQAVNWYRQRSKSNGLLDYYAELAAAKKQRNGQ